MSRAKKQIDAISDYVDYTYVATDRLPKSWEMDGVGLLFVDESNMHVIKRARKIVDSPKIDSLFALPKKCLTRFLGDINRKNALKSHLVRQIRNQCSGETLKQCVKRIVLCQRCSDKNCPVLSFISNSTSEFEPNPPDAFF